MAVGSGHEPGRLLVASEDKRYPRALAQRLDEVKVLVTGIPEDVLDAFTFQRADKQFGSVHAIVSSRANGAGAIKRSL